MSGPRSIRPGQPVGSVTRGTTNPNRLRRVDRWMVHALSHVLRAPAEPPVVVDLGYGSSAVTVLELHRRLAPVRSDVEVVGVEIDPDRVVAALPYADPPAVQFARGGFEVPVPQDRPPVLVRAFNVLRQYDEREVADAWQRVVDALAPDGALVEGTCDEIGRLSTWVDVRRGEDGAARPRTLSLSWRLTGLERPSVIAERLPKALIHRNVPGERVHDLMRALDRAWEVAAPHAAFGSRQRFQVAARDLHDQGWPVLDGPRRWRLGEFTVAWQAVAPDPT